MEYKLLNTRIEALRHAVGCTQAEMARRGGVSRSFYSQVEGGHTKPSIELVLGIAKNVPHINTLWLLTGEGPMFLEPTPQGTSAQEEQELRELRLLGRAAPQALVWRVLHSLESHREGLRLAELQAKVECTEEALLATLISLRREKRIVQDGDVYRLVLPSSVRASSYGDQGAIVNVGLETLLESVLPGLERGQAGVLVSELRVEDVEAWHKLLHGRLVELMTAQDLSTGQRVRVVLAACAIDPSGE